MAQTVVHMVRVMTDSRDQHLWMAAVPPDEAITQILNAVPEGWAATVLPSYALSSNEVAALQLGPGEIREITSKRN